MLASIMPTPRVLRACGRGAARRPLKDPTKLRLRTENETEALASSSSRLASKWTRLQEPCSPLSATVLYSSRRHGSRKSLNCMRVREIDCLCLSLDIQASLIYRLRQEMILTSPA